MSAITFEVPDDLAMRLRSREDQLSQILELGLREIDAENREGFEGAGEVMEILARLPSPEEVIALRPSPRLQARIEALLEKNRTASLNEDEEREWQRYEYLEHLVRVAKAQARKKLGTPTIGSANG